MKNGKDNKEKKIYLNNEDKVIGCQLFWLEFCVSGIIVNNNTKNVDKSKNIRSLLFRMVYGKA